MALLHKSDFILAMPERPRRLAPQLGDILWKEFMKIDGPEGWERTFHDYAAREAIERLLINSMDTEIADLIYAGLACEFLERWPESITSDSFPYEQFEAYRRERWAQLSDGDRVALVRKALSPQNAIAMQRRCVAIVATIGTVCTRFRGRVVGSMGEGLPWNDYYNNCDGDGDPSRSTIVTSTVAGVPFDKKAERVTGILRKRKSQLVRVP